MNSGSRLERVLRSGRFAVTAELNPPDSADPQAVYDRALVLASVCDAINATDASGANVHMSSVGVCALLTRAGYEPVMQVSCRDKNRIAIQGDLLGAAAMGVRNLLCLTGDGVQAGDQPESKPVFDLDSISLLRTARILRDEGRFLSGRVLEAAPRFFLGAAANPFVPPLDFRPLRLAKKAEAGAEFVQTQFCFDLSLMRRYMTAVRDLGLHERVFILAGVGPLRSAKTAEWLRSRVPGVVIPEDVIRRLRSVPAERQREEGKRLCVEIIRELREIEGVSGVHVMAYRQEELVAEIIEESGLLPRRQAGRNAQVVETEDASS
jgi:methylenetetrahydrofolate reductase (NADPH)